MKYNNLNGQKGGEKCMFSIILVLLVAVDTRGGGPNTRHFCLSDISNLRRDMKSVANYNVTG